MKLTRLGLLHHGVTRLLLLFSLAAGVATRDDCAADVASFPVTPQSPSNEQYFQLEKKAGQLILLGETTRCAARAAKRC